MSVNQSYGISEKRTKHLGKYFSTIDFEVNKCSKQQIEVQTDITITGRFWINERSQEVSLKVLNSVANEGCLDNLKLPDNLTKAETDRIIETFMDAKNIFWQKVKLNV